MDFKKHQKFVLKLSVSVVSVLLLLIIVPGLAYLSDVEVVYTILPNTVYQLLHNLFFAAQLSCAALALKERFKLLNEYLKGLTVTLDERNKIILSKQETFNLELFSALYNDLCDAIAIANSTFTNQIVIVIINLLLTDVLTAYGWLREFMSRTHLLMFLSFLNFMWISCEYAIKAMIAHSGSSTTNEAENSLVLLTRVIENLKSNEKMKADMNLLLTQMRYRNKKLQNIVFTIDWKLVLAVSFYFLWSFESDLN